MNPNHHNSDLKQRVSKLAESACDFIIDKSTRNRLNLCMSYFFWPEKEVWNPRISELDDIGDFLTFVAYWGILSGNQKHQNFVRNQLEIWHETAKLPGGLYFSKIDHDKALPLKEKVKIASLYDLQDAILGFHELFRLTKDDFYKQEFEEIAAVLIFYIKKYHGLAPNAVFLPFKCALPHVSSSPIVGGLFAEELSLFSEINGKNEYLKAAEMIIKAWINTALFQKEALFHVGYNPYLPFFSLYKNTELMKSNTNMLYAMLQYLKLKKDLEIEEAALKFFEGLGRFRADGGGYFGSFNLKNSSVEKNAVDKTQNFAVISVYLEAFRYFQNDAYLKEAEAVAAFWISKMNIDTGLIPERFSDGETIFSGAKIDQSGDLAMEFLKLHEITGKEIYFETAKKTFEAMEKYYRTPSNWWYRIIDSESGKPMTDNPEEDGVAGGRNLTKYVGGALKFFLAFYQRLNGVSLFDDKIAWILLRDR